jgi:hypothetical protein
VLLLAANNKPVNGSMNSPIENHQKPASWGWRGKLAALLATNGSVTSDKTKVASDLTHTKRAQVLFASFEELRKLGYKIKDPGNLKPKHMAALVDFWEKESQSPSTIQNKISVFRVFAGWIKKDGMIPAAESLVKTPGAATRSYVTKEPKGWTVNGVSLEVIEQVEQFDARV